MPVVAPIIHARSLALRRCALAAMLVCALGVHQVVMASPLYGRVLAMGVFAAVESPAPHYHAHDADSTDNVSDPAAPHHLRDGAMGAARLTAPSALPLLPLALAVAFALIVVRWRGTPAPQVAWLWPPARRRALLQVFLC